MKNEVLGFGRVYHCRHGHKVNRFTYPTFFLFLNSRDEVNYLRTLRHQFRGVLNFKGADYLNSAGGVDGKGGALDARIRSFLTRNFNFTADTIWLQTMPRMFGFVFNPVSFWYCMASDKLEAVLVEVNNTFGERHFYWLGPELMQGPESWIEARKVFHVSPFLPVEGFYRFRFRIAAEAVRADIHYFSQDGKLSLTTWIEGRFKSMRELTWLRLMWNYGWMTPLVVMRIHLQALRLFLKRVRFHHKPPPPVTEIR